MEEENRLLVGKKGTANKVDQYATKLSNGLLWLNERAWPLTVGILSVAGLYLYQYIQVEKVPLSILSAAAFTALPAMFAMLVFVIGMMGASILIPTFILFKRMNRTGVRLSDQLNLSPASPQATAQHRRVLWHWAASVAVPCVFWPCAVYLSAKAESGPLLTVSWIAAVVLVVMAYVWIIVRARPAHVALRDISGEFLFASASAGGIQLLVILMVTVPVSHAFGEYSDSIVLFAPFMATEMIVLFLIQGCGACMVVSMSDHENPAAPVSLVVFSLLVVLGMIPEAGAKLGGLPLQASASGGRACTLMTWTDDAKALRVLVDADNPQRSVKLRVMADSDGSYIVRPWQAREKTVSFVPHASVAQLDECP
ncbi:MULTISPECIES: hypothetical protein [Pseudomonas fluorescens group]|uniref:Uncharacterized protein n=1 Tax=Pseudomonas fluorescens TaxID=294 RepID=A0AAE2U4W2_PSEFL|nr:MULTISPECIES: hypothetical protein [Pseudomonas fluorescens group]MBA1429275.1 hypothetical protein [Pseudomonas orientalis]MBD8270548.1 hypothetical protein [Pseudomonas fluorescens]